MSKEATPARTDEGKVFTVAGAIEAGEALAKLKDELADKLSANRELCRLMVRNNFTNDEQTAAIEKLYPSQRAKPKPAPEAPAPESE